MFCQIIVIGIQLMWQVCNWVKIPFSCYIDIYKYCEQNFVFVVEYSNSYSPKGSHTIAKTGEYCEYSLHLFCAGMNLILIRYIENLRILWILWIYDSPRYFHYKANNSLWKKNQKKNCLFMHSWDEISKYSGIDREFGANI